MASNTAKRLTINYESTQSEAGVIPDLLMFEDEYIEDIPEHKDYEQLEFKVTRFRFLILFLFMNCIIIISSICTSLTPAASNIGQAYGVSTTFVNFCSIGFSFTYPPMALVSIWMFENLSPALVMRIGAVNLFIGCWFRMIVLT